MQIHKENRMKEAARLLFSPGSNALVDLLLRCCLVRFVPVSIKSDKEFRSGNQREIM